MAEEDKKDLSNEIEKSQNNQNTNQETPDNPPEKEDKKDNQTDNETANSSSEENGKEEQKSETTNEEYEKSQNKDLSKIYKPETLSKIKIKIVATVIIVLSGIFMYGLIAGTDNKPKVEKPLEEQNVDLNKMENKGDENQISFPSTYERKTPKYEEFDFENIPTDNQGSKTTNFILKKEAVNPLKVEYYNVLYQEELNARKSEIGFKQTFEQAKEEFKAENMSNYPQQTNPFVEPDLNRQAEKKNFFRNEEQKKIYNSGRELYAVSPYEVKAGTFIPGALISGINSNLPGDMKGIVREDVYDTVTGNHLLIPKGTTLIGTYDSNVTFGQNRALVIWQRLIFPNGKTVLLDNMGGVDLSGYAGLKDKVNNHNLELFKAVVLSSILGAGTAIVSDEDDDDNDWKAEAGRGAGEQIITIGNRLADKLLALQPTIEIRPGQRLNIMLHSDLILTPYEGMR